MARKRFTKEFVGEVVQEVLDGLTQMEVAAKYGISAKTLSRWCLSAKAKLAPEQLAENQELQRLRKEVRQLQAENEFLKKAASYFARQQ